MTEQSGADSEFLTLTEAMYLLKVSRRTIYNWFETGRLTRYDTPGGSPRVKREELLRERGVEA